MTNDLFVPDELAPTTGEMAVVSLLAFADDDEWVVRAGSVLTMPSDWARTSWRVWSARQPRVSPGHIREGLDFGPNFQIDPFPGVRLERRAVSPEEWWILRTQLEAGRIAPGLTDYRCELSEWGSTVLLPTERRHGPTDVISRAARPVRSVAGSCVAPSSPDGVDGNWSLPLQPDVPRGPVHGAQHRNRSLVHWADELVGVDWIIGHELEPPSAFVIGRLVSSAWIAGVDPDPENDGLAVAIAWEADQIDPFSLSIALRLERDGLCLLDRAVKVSDLPAGDAEQLVPRRRAWNERLLTVHLPRGPAGTDWGLALRDAPGDLLDGRDCAARIERIDLTISVMDAPGTETTTTIGDQRDPPGAAERDALLATAEQLTAQSRESAAGRRLSTRGELREYLLWRLSARSGELLLLDPFFAAAGVGTDETDFLRRLDRPIRALTAKENPAALTALATVPGLSVRLLPGGQADLHDRVWIFGETGLLVGGSVNTFLGSPSSPTRATTATELPPSDVNVWRARFEAWWSPGKPL